MSAWVRIRVTPWAAYHSTVRVAFEDVLDSDIALVRRPDVDPLRERPALVPRGVARGSGGVEVDVRFDQRRRHQPPAGVVPAVGRDPGRVALARGNHPFDRPPADLDIDRVAAERPAVGHDVIGHTRWSRSRRLTISAYRSLIQKRAYKYGHKPQFYTHR